MDFSLVEVVGKTRKGQFHSQHVIRCELAMQAILQFAIPIALFVLMFVVGLDVVGEHLFLAARRWLLVLAATVAQAVVLPVIAIIIVRLWNLDPLNAVGLVLIATCPGGGISNSYTYLARGNTALSIVLTTASCALAVITMPIALESAGQFVIGAEKFAIPPSAIVIQLFLFVLLPIAMGMTLRKHRPAFVERHRRLGERLSFVLIAALVLLIIALQPGRFVE